MKNMEIYEAVRTPPKEALKKITAGRLKDMTDINPMWRIKALTELFGPCGIGWKPVIVKQWTETGSDGTICAFCNVDLYIKEDDKWSDPIPGTGGSMLVSKERNGLYTSDECFKMAYTDAISVACKMLGFAADIHWEKDKTKYPCENPDNPDKAEPQNNHNPICAKCGEKIKGIIRGGKEYTADEVSDHTSGLCYHCFKENRKSDSKEEDKKEKEAQYVGS